MLDQLVELEMLDKLLGFFRNYQNSELILELLFLEWLVLDQFSQFSQLTS